ncbi:MAG TPA: hypothetical protein ACFCUY_04485 [Xenococcaceae cyanobacterium]
MLEEIWQEMIALKQNQIFRRNLIIVGISAIALPLTLITEYRHPGRLAQQERIAEFSNLVSVGMVIRTYETLLNKDY